MLTMRTFDNQNPNIPTESTENNVPTPLEVQANLAKQGIKTAVLGEHFEDEVETTIPPSAEVRSWEEQMALDETEVDARNSLSPLAPEDDTLESSLDGFTVVDSTAEGDVDELPEDLKDELGDPDSDEDADNQ